MKILHYIPQSDDLINRYVNLLTDSMGLEANNTVATSEGDAKESLNSSPYDILHIHGCWQRSAYRIFKMAAGKGVRMVLSPYGQLEPWVVDENYWKEKLPKKLLYQRHLVERGLCRYHSRQDGRGMHSETGLEPAHGNHPQPHHHPLHHLYRNGTKDLYRLSQGA